MNVIFERVESIAAQRQDHPQIPTYETKVNVLTERTLDVLPVKGDEVRIKGRLYGVKRTIWYLDGETYETDQNVYRSPFVVIRVGD